MVRVQEGELKIKNLSFLAGVFYFILFLGREVYPERNFFLQKVESKEAQEGRNKRKGYKHQNVVAFSYLHTSCILFPLF